MIESETRIGTPRTGSHGTNPEDDYDRKLLSDIESHGWHLVAISEDDEPAYVFSVGLYHSLGHPEICILGLGSTQIMGQIINGIGHLVRDGECFDDWEESDEVLEGYSCLFRSVAPEMYREYFGYARWYYEGDGFPMLQCIWPDSNHRYPWEGGYESQPQPVLAAETGWPFADAKNLGVFTTRQVLEEAYPILLVTHDEDGDWQFLCGTTDDEDDARLVSLASVVEDHPSVTELADLPLGWQAEREAPDQPWRRSQQ